MQCGEVSGFVVWFLCLPRSLHALNDHLGHIYTFRRGVNSSSSQSTLIRSARPACNLYVVTFLGETSALFITNVTPADARGLLGVGE